MALRSKRKKFVADQQGRQSAAPGAGLSSGD